MPNDETTSGDLLEAAVGLLSPEQLSEYLQIPVDTLYRWRSDGGGPRAIRVGKHLRYRPADVQVWLIERAGRS